MNKEKIREDLEDNNIDRINCIKINFSEISSIDFIADFYNFYRFNFLWALNGFMLYTNFYE